MPLAKLAGGWELLLLLTIGAILVVAIKMLSARRNRSSKALDPLQRIESRDGAESSARFSIRVFVAQGLGLGRIPFAPGTFGSFLGLVWFAALISTGNLWAYFAGAIEGVAFSIWLCDDAEKIMGEKDPGSVVLDEIIAIPFCFLPWVASEWIQSSTLPPVPFFFEGDGLWITLGLVALFRLFDIWKPWPVRQLQNLPGGWGVTIDDLFAAAYVALVWIGIRLCQGI